MVRYKDGLLFVWLGCEYEELPIKHFHCISAYGGRINKIHSVEELVDSVLNQNQPIKWDDDDESWYETRVVSLVLNMN